ncbi:hypothetical protein H9L39_16898 [Fusarium oxysporum f. sp. albedinis]|nr:hypothetical protein H9L39_16898 [Fusarium oxysporum f. sp. albedinis]
MHSPRSDKHGDDEIASPGLGMALKGCAAVGGSKSIHAHLGWARRRQEVSGASQFAPDPCTYLTLLQLIVVAFVKTLQGSRESSGKS